VSDVPTWAQVLLYVAAAIAAAAILYAAVYLAVRQALRAASAEQRAAAGRSEELLRAIAASTEYVADVADAWAEGEAERRAARAAGPAPLASTPAPSSPPPAGEDGAGAGEGNQ
jgi:hypothetical protein